MVNVNDPQFWRDRLENSPELRMSVFVTSKQHWDVINEDHLATLNKLIPDGSKVLDAGCGYGRLYPLFHEKQCEYLGVDISPDFIEIAKEKYGNNFIVGDLSQLELPDESFDYAFCISIKGMIERELGKEDWKKIQYELLRVAKKLIILEYGSHGDYVIYSGSFSKDLPSKIYEKVE